MKTLSMLNNEEATQVAKTIIGDIADHIPVIQDSMIIDEEESYNFIAILKDMNENHSEQAREILAYLLGIGSEDLDLHIQETIEETLNQSD